MLPALEKIITAHGGLAHWRSLATIELELSASGFLFAYKRIPVMQHVRVVVNTQTPQVTFHDYPSIGKVTRFLGEHLVQIEDASGKVLQSREHPRAMFSHWRRFFYWDALDFAYFGGYAFWNYVTTPFLLTNQAVKVEELADDTASKLTKFTVTFPEYFPTHSQQQAFYFNQAGQLHRLDYTTEVLGAWANAAHFCEDYKTFSGLSLPTKRRVYPKLIGNHPFKAITMVAVDIHSVTLR